MKPQRLPSAHLLPFQGFCRLLVLVRVDINKRSSLGARGGRALDLTGSKGQWCLCPGNLTGLQCHTLALTLTSELTLDLTAPAPLTWCGSAWLTTGFTEPRDQAGTLWACPYQTTGQELVTGLLLFCFLMGKTNWGLC